MPINLANVNVSIAQFQNIATGKYNAGEVKLASETTLDKVNNHVHFTRSNKKELSHEEVLAIKTAFVRALSSNGVGAEEIAQIRRDLGLSAEAGMDRSLHERSLRPLTRQQVREILDRNVDAINAHAAGTVRTAAQMNAGRSERTIQARANARDAANAGLVGSRGTQEHEGIALAEAAIAGDVDFRSFEESRNILAQARAQLNALLERSKGQPSAEREAVVEFRIRESGQTIRISTGMTELSFARRLEETILRLAAYQADDRSIDVRTAFGAIDGAAARNTWLDGLAAAADGGFKARTVAIMLLTEAGIGDWETLSLVNRVSDADALALAKGLVELNGGVRGDALRQNALLQTLAQRAQGGAEVPQNARATIPAFSPQQWNEAVRVAIIQGRPENLPHDIRALADEAPADLRRRFGAKFFPANETGFKILCSVDSHKLVPDGLPERVTAENLRERLAALQDRLGAERCAQDHIAQALAEAGGVSENESALWNDWQDMRPQLYERLCACHSAAETAAVFAEVRETVEADARRHIAVSRACEKVRAYYKEAFAQRLGLPSACVDGSLHLDRFQDKANELARQIRKGEVNAVTDAEVEAAFRSLAEDAVAQRADRIAAIDAMEDISPALADRLKEHILEVDRPEKIDIVRCVRAARTELGQFIDGVEAALDAPNADKTAVYEAMRAVSSRLGGVVHGLFPPGEEVGGEELFMLGTPMMATLIHDRPGLAEKLAAFFARPDVLSDDFFNPLSAANSADPFRGVLPNPQARDELAASLGTTAMPPFHAQALFKAFEDAGLGALSAAERMAVLRPSHPAGAALANAISNEPGTVSPSRLRELAAPILQSRANAAPFARSQADAARMESLLEKYGGGLAPADRERLREFADILDFSEQGATASETAIAGRLDEICGGGGFDNPASSASRRAVAADATAEDLRFLSHCAKLLYVSRYTPEEILDGLADPQSAFRRPLDAALARFAGHPPRALSLEQKTRIALAVFECDDDADLQEIVSHGIARVLTSGTAVLRDEAAVVAIVARVRANLEELRAATAGDPELFAAGKRLLLGLETRRIPAGYIAYLLDAARAVPLASVSRLKPRSPAVDIHAAALDLRAAIDGILIGRDSEKLLDGADEIIAVRTFLCGIFAARLTPAQRQAVRGALQGQNASQLVGLYQDVSDMMVDPPEPTQGGERNAWCRVAGESSRALQLLDASLARLLGAENPDAGIPFPPGQVNYAAIRGTEIGRSLLAIARETIASVREKFLREIAPGTSPAARAMRGIYSAKIGPAPYEPDTAITKAFSNAMKNFLGYTAVREAKRLAASDDLAGTKFAQTRASGLEVELPGGERLSADPAAARDQIARFVTGRPDAVWATLTAGERNQTAVVMALLTQEATLAATEGAATALDPEGRNPAFTLAGGTAGARRGFRLERSDSGTVTIVFRTESQPTALVVGGQTHALGPNDRFRGGYTCVLNPYDMENIAQMDLAGADIAAAEEFFNRNPPEADRLSGAFGRLPQANRVGLVVTPTFELDIA